MVHLTSRESMLVFIIIVSMDYEIMISMPDRIKFVQLTICTV